VHGQHGLPEQVPEPVAAGNIPPPVRDSRVHRQSIRPGRHRPRLPTPTMLRSSWRWSSPGSRFDMLIQSSLVGSERTCAPEHRALRSRHCRRNTRAECAPAPQAPAHADTRTFARIMLQRDHSRPIAAWDRNGADGSADETPDHRARTENRDQPDDPRRIDPHARWGSGNASL